jgi:hypothetical protein
MADALTPEQIAANIKKAEEIRSKPEYYPESMNDRPLGSTVRFDLEQRLKDK